MAEITDIRVRRRGSRRRRVYLDGMEWRAVPQDVVRELGLRVGQAVEPDDLEARIAEVEPAQAWARALRLMDYRERSSEELRGRLAEDGFGEDAVEAAVSRASDLGFLDDRRFAAGLAERLTMKGRGRSRMAAELSARGVPGELASDVLDSCCPREEERSRAESLAARMVHACRYDPRRLAARLVRAGFETGVSWAVARDVCESADHASDEG